MSVTVKLIGGLGNQLFQLANGLSYSKKYNKNFVVEKIESSPSIFQNRSIYWDSLFQQLNGGTVNNPICYKEREFEFIPIPFFSEDLILDGYYQSPLYIDNTILDLLFPIQFRTEAKKLAEPLKDRIFLHFRRGDYKKLSYFHRILPMSYYEQAISRFETKKFLIVCEQEDESDIRRDLPICIKENCIFIDFSLKDYQQLLLMSELPLGGVIANSSFSWWSAYLGRLSHKTAKYIAPKLWFLAPLLNSKIKILFEPDWGCERI